jgi:hypothetical protein
VTEQTDTTTVRTLHLIAQEIADDWSPNVNFAAKPYLEAMFSLGKITDTYGMESGRSIVQYFVSNALSWRGETAKRVKAELRGML